jgi:hypothetical protein
VLQSAWTKIRKGTRWHMKGFGSSNDQDHLAYGELEQSQVSRGWNETAVVILLVGVNSHGLNESHFHLRHSVNDTRSLSRCPLRKAIFQSCYQAVADVCLARDRTFQRQLRSFTRTVSLLPLFPDVCSLVTSLCMASSSSRPQDRLSAARPWLEEGK